MKLNDNNLVAVDGAVATGIEIRGLVVGEPALVHVVGSDVSSTCATMVSTKPLTTYVRNHTEVDVGLSGVGATNPRGSSHRASLVEGDELVKVVHVGEHLQSTY